MSRSIKYSSNDPYYQILSGVLETKAWAFFLYAFQVTDNSHSDSYLWNRCFDSAVKAKPWDLKGQDFMLLCPTKVGIPCSLELDTVEYNLLVLKPTGKTENPL